MNGNDILTIYWKKFGYGNFFVLSVLFTSYIHFEVEHQPLLSQNNKIIICGKKDNKKARNIFLKS